MLANSNLNMHLKTTTNDCGVSIHNCLQIFREINELMLRVNRSLRAPCQDVQEGIQWYRELRVE